ncbi:hypothetical protein RCL1_004213 [Eukaryota sp. TZLM3-RCL]
MPNSSRNDSTPPSKKARLKYEPPSSPASLTFTHDILRKLLLARSDNLLTDFHVCFLDKSFPCHRAVVVCHSSVLNITCQTHIDSFVVTDEIGCKEEHYLQFLLFLYGEEIILDSSNAIFIFELARHFGSRILRQHAKDVCISGSLQTLRINVPLFLKNISEDQFKDHVLVYKSKAIKVHKFFMAALIPFFKTKWCDNNQNLDLNDESTDFSECFSINEDCFEVFFLSFYSGSLEINSEFVYEFSVLSRFFEVDEIEQLCSSFEPSSEWLFPALYKANAAGDVDFIEKSLPNLAFVKEFDQLLALPPLAFKFIHKTVPISWIIHNLVFSFINYCDKSLWTSLSFFHCLEQFKDSILALHSGYEIIPSILQPALEVAELRAPVCEFCVKYFQPKLSASYSQLETQLEQQTKALHQLQREYNKVSVNLRDRERVMKRVRIFSPGDRVTITDASSSFLDSFLSIRSEVGVITSLRLKEKLATVDFPCRKDVVLAFHELEVYEFVDVSGQ